MIEPRWYFLIASLTCRYASLSTLRKSAYARIWIICPIFSSSDIFLSVFSAHLFPSEVSWTASALEYFSCFANAGITSKRTRMMARSLGVGMQGRYQRMKLERSVVAQLAVMQSHAVRGAKSPGAPDV